VNPLFQVRPAGEADLEALLRIGAQSPEAAQWQPDAYRDRPCLVALSGARVVGFLGWRAVASDEREILNLAVDPAFRRRGVASLLVRRFLEDFAGTVFLEVRASNQAARKFYEELGFRQVGLRRGYYPPDWEDAVVMGFRSC
jgi:[ribosomal protein S18]-alanine N-acetyltransferase